MEVSNLSAILEFFTSVIDIIKGLIESIISLITMLATGAATLVTVIAYMPIQYQAPLIALISYCVLVVILHQGSE